MPPDLVVEVNHSHASIRKIPIYAKLAVVEIWRWRYECLTVLRLESGEYIEMAQSLALAGFPLDQLRLALARRNEVSQTALLQEFQKGLNGL